MIKYAILLMSIFIVFSGCDVVDHSYDDAYDNLQNMDVKEAVSKANDWSKTKPKITSYINDKELIFTFPDDREVKMPLPEDEMYVAFAPYIDDNHSCTTHYMSSCKGELVRKAFKLKAIDNNGATLYDGDITTVVTGFFGLWLPRNRTIGLFIEYGDLSAEVQITTTPGSNTCVTTARLK